MEVQSDKGMTKENSKTTNSNLLNFTHQMIKIPERNLSEHSKKLLRENGVRVRDIMRIVPLQGRAQRIVLNRTKYFFSSPCSNATNATKEGTNIFSLPILQGQSFTFELVLCVNIDTKNSGSSGSGSADEEGRFLIRSSADTPFVINGVASFESFVERGDKVCMGYNNVLFEANSAHLSGLTLNQEKEELTSHLTSHPILLNKKILNSEINIYIEGETGTGKTYLANKIHQQSDRAGAFVHINLSAFSSTLLESELFGHVKGAFTGAVSEKKGAIREADRGTLFLDEIDSLPKELQTKLLLFLDGKKVRAVGGCGDQNCDIRIIFASIRSPESLVKRGEMRDDFFYRISTGIRIHLDPLRKMPEKIQKWCKLISWEEDISIPSNLVNLYSSLSWPGNLRQFLTHIKRKKMMTKGRKLQMDELDETLIKEIALFENKVRKIDTINTINTTEGKMINLTGFNNIDEEELLPLDEYKKRYILKTYYRLGGNIIHTANILKISSNTVRNALK